jgi:arsenate reductase
MTAQVFNLLILCTGNSARSIMAEALFNTIGEGRFKAYSAGSFPNGKVNPYAIEILKEIGYPTTELRSKSWDEFTLPDAPQMDFVITVCDNAANEVCPVWPGAPVNAHWGFEDPAALEATEDEKRALFRKVFHQIRQRVEIFSALSLTELSSINLQHEIAKIGNMGCEL